MKNKILVILFLALLISPFKLEAKADSSPSKIGGVSSHSSPSKIEGVGGSMKAHSAGNHTPQSLRASSSILEEQLPCSRIGENSLSSMEGVSSHSSPSKIEGAGGSMKAHSAGNHTPQSLRASSSILEEQLPCSRTGESSPSKAHQQPCTSVSSDTVMRGSSPFSSLEDRKRFIKHIRDSIDAIPFDTTRDDDYWRRAIVNGKWSFFTDPTVKKPGLLNFASKVYNFYTKAFNNYDTAYVASVKKNYRIIIKNNNWFDTYGGQIANQDTKIFMNSNISSSMGIGFSYMGIGYTYMFDLDNLFGGDPTRHSKWEMTFATSRFSFEAYHTRNSGTVNIHRFGDYNNGKYIDKEFNGLERVSTGFDLYYFFNHRKYSQAAAYSYSKIQKRSAGTFIAGLLMTTQSVELDFNYLDKDMKEYVPNGGVPIVYKYHYRVFSLLGGYAYNWVFRRNWLFNVTAAPSIGLNHSFEDSVDGRRNQLSFDLRGRLGLVYRSRNFFYGLQIIIDAHFYHSKKHDFVNSNEDLTLVAGFNF